MTASILGTGLLLSLFALPARWTVLVFALVFLLAAWEWTGFGGLTGPAQRGAYTAAMAALMVVSWLWSADAGHLLLLLGSACLWWAAALLWLLFAPGRVWPLPALLCGIPVLIPAFTALGRMQIAAAGVAPGPDMVLWMLLLVSAADIGAFFAGRALGRHKLAPRVSPGKTWEGAMGGLAAAALMAAAGTVYFGLPAGYGLAFGCAVGVLSIIGDLTESMFKRAAGLKDSGSLLPGHGGVLDRMDSVTAAAPLYALGLFGWGVIR